MSALTSLPLETYSFKENGRRDDFASKRKRSDHENQRKSNSSTSMMKKVNIDTNLRKALVDLETRKKFELQVLTRMMESVRSVLERTVKRSG